MHENKQHDMQLTRRRSRKREEIQI